MDVYKILDNVKEYASDKFKIGFVGNGEPLLDWDRLKGYLVYIKDNEYINSYIISNGTVGLSDDDLLFIKEHRCKLSFSLDGYKELHDKYRCNSFDKVMNSVENYKRVLGVYPRFNATVGRESLEHADKIIDFFKQFGTRVTFSRMIGKYSISLKEYHDFMDIVSKEIEVRRGGFDCTMYGGKCGAGINNYFFANNNIYYCGNCIDMKSLGKSDISFEELEKINLDFDRTCCYKEVICG